MKKTKNPGKGALSDVDWDDVETVITTTVKVIKDLLKPKK